MRGCGFNWRPATGLVPQEALEHTLPPSFGPTWSQGGWPCVPLCQALIADI